MANPKKKITHSRKGNRYSKVKMRFRNNHSPLDNLMGGMIAPHGIDCNFHTLGCRLFLLLFLLDHELAIVVPTVRADVM